MHVKPKNVSSIIYIYSIGYEGRDLTTFIQTLKDNGIEQVIDIRYSNECSDPHFSGNFFAEQLS
jgi:uncharacterized protein (DUF488 family)